MEVETRVAPQGRLASVARVFVWFARRDIAANVTANVTKR